jgi:hypothetical protein
MNFFKGLTYVTVLSKGVETEVSILAATFAIPVCLKICFILSHFGPWTHLKQMKPTDFYMRLSGSTGAGPLCDLFGTRYALFVLEGLQCIFSHASIS